MTGTLTSPPRAVLGDAFTRSRLLKLVMLLAAICGFAALTMLTFLAMAGHPDPALRWPTNFELRFVDNPFLWLIARDVVEGQRVVFASSGQDFLFPEVLISIASYLFAGGEIHWYYVVVAAINNAILFGLVFALARCLYRQAGFWRQLALAFAASLPLLFGALSASSLVFVLHLAPNYNFDLDIGILLAALVILARTTPARVILSVLWALVAASNLLTVVFTVPVAVIVLAVKYIRFGVRAVHRAGIWLVVTVGSALALNALLFRVRHDYLPFSIHSNSSKSYVDLAAVEARLSTVAAQLKTALDGAPMMIFATVCAAVTLIAAVFAIRAYLRDAAADDVRLGRVFLLLFPVVGAAAALAVTLLYDWYLWPLLLGSQVVCLLVLLPKRLWVAVAAVGTGAVLALTLFGGNIARSAQTYFDVRAAGVDCVDAHVPAGSMIYAKTDNARIVASQSTKGIRAIQILREVSVGDWLNNLAEAADYDGEIHDILLSTPGPGGDADAADYVGDARAKFGEPDVTFVCETDAATGRQFELWHYERNINVTSGPITR